MKKDIAISILKDIQSTLLQDNCKESTLNIINYYINELNKSNKQKD